MAAVPLQVPGNLGGIPVPPSPALIPTLEDVQSAQIYLDRIKQSHESGAEGSATAEDIVYATRYHQTVLEQSDSVAPLWWGQFGQQLDLILNQRKQATKQLQELLHRMNILENHDRGEKDTDLPFHIIKFCSPEHTGVDPTTLGLPRILNVQSLRGMGEQAVDAYCKGYSICVAPESDYDQRKEQILRYIG
ncbi:hypothetical protein C8J56DRAFT_940559, partial [Mycena floridula]